MASTILRLLKQLDRHLATVYFPTSPTRFEQIYAGLGSTAFCVAVLAATEACVVIFGGQHGPWVALINLISIGLTFSVSQAVKCLVVRLRPHDDLPILPLISAPDKHSFPSSHAAGTFCVATSIGVFYREITPLVLAVALCISTSRIVARLHYPSDILVGSVLGSSIALVVGMMGKFVIFG